MCIRDSAKADATITVSIARHAGGVALSVTDNGPGIDPAQADRLLQRGVQGAGGLAMGLGAGLGLSIVRRYAQLLGATLSLEPAAQGRGLTATARLQPADETSGPGVPSKTGQLRVTMGAVVGG